MDIKCIWDKDFFTYEKVDNLTFEQAKEVYYGSYRDDDRECMCIGVENLDIAEIKGLSPSQKDIIHSNLAAYKANFGYVRLEKPFSNFDNILVYAKPDALPEEYIQDCENLDYLNGWLYGAVQANNHVIKSIR